jgi:hypothetical protein
MTERRKEERYVVPELYRKYVTFKIRDGSSEFVPAELHDFSLNGVKIRTPHGLSVDSTLECLIGVPKSLTKEIPLTVRIKYCTKDEPAGNYLSGAEIILTGERIWLDLFSKVHDFIKERIGDIF